jgi:predicted cupin superfamily sugar epimerase
VDDDVKRLIERFRLTPLPVEGTLFRNTYRGSLPSPDSEPTGTAIIGLFVAEPVIRSLFHRLTRDEIWHFYAGDPIRLVLLDEDGSDREVVLGNGVLDGQSPQLLIPAGTWQAGELVVGGRWALFGCTMAPGFTPDCFEGGRISDLIARYPDRAHDIRRLGLPDDHNTTMPADVD